MLIPRKLRPNQTLSWFTLSVFFSVICLTCICCACGFTKFSTCNDIGWFQFRHQKTKSKKRRGPLRPNRKPNPKLRHPLQWRSQGRSMPGRPKNRTRYLPTLVPPKDLEVNRKTQTSPSRSNSFVRLVLTSSHSLYLFLLTLSYYLFESYDSFWSVLTCFNLATSFILFCCLFTIVPFILPSW